MLKKIFAFAIVLAGLTVTLGCHGIYGGYSTGPNLRRVMIANEQFKLAGQDLDRVADLSQYPTSGEVNH